MGSGELSEQDADGETVCGSVGLPAVSITVLRCSGPRSPTPDPFRKGQEPQRPRPHSRRGLRPPLPGAARTLDHTRRRPLAVTPASEPRPPLPTHRGAPCCVRARTPARPSGAHSRRGRGLELSDPIPHGPRTPDPAAAAAA